jgi:hypothetical protein
MGSIPPRGGKSKVRRTVADMPKTFLYAGIALAVGCASRPDFSSISTNSVSVPPAVELPDDAAGHQHVSSDGQSGSVARDDDVWTPSQPSTTPRGASLARVRTLALVDDELGFDSHNSSVLTACSSADSHPSGCPESNPHGASLLPNWSSDEADSATSDKAAVPLPNYIVEKEVPPEDAGSKTAKEPSARPRKNPFMLLRLTETKNPQFRQ